MSTDTKKGPNQLTIEQRKDEHDAPVFEEMSQEAYIEFLGENEAFVVKVGTQSIISRLKLSQLNIIAKYIAEIPFKDLAKANDLKISEILNK